MSITQVSPMYHPCIIWELLNKFTKERIITEISQKLLGLCSKLLSKGEDRSPLKYIVSVLLSDSEYFIEKKFGLSTRVWVSVLEGPKLLSRGQTLGTKSAKKCCYVGTL